MNRRSVLAIPGAIIIAGCSQFEEVASDVSNSDLSLGESATFGEIEVTVTDSMTAEQFTFNGEEIVSPDNGTYALFEIKSRNTDVTEREIPHVSDTHYETLEEEDGVIYMGDINDIRVFGDGDGGHFPDVDWGEEYGWEEEDGTLVRTGEIDFRVDGEELEPYPVGTARPRIEADSSVSGWTVGVIDADATPELRINFDGTEETWAADG